MSLRRDAAPGSSGKEDSLKRMFDEKAAFQGLVGTIEDIGVIKTDPNNPNRQISDATTLSEWIKDFEGLMQMAKEQDQTSKGLVLSRKENHERLIKIMIVNTGQNQGFYVYQTVNGYEFSAMKHFQISSDEEWKMMVFVMNSAVFQNATSLTDTYWSFLIKN